MTQFLADHIWLHIAVSMLSATIGICVVDYIWRNRRP